MSDHPKPNNWYGEPPKIIVPKPIRYKHVHKSQPEKLHVVIVVSNPCEYKRRWQLAREFIQRVKDHPNIHLHIVELLYPNQTQVLENSFVLRTEHPIWHKESMINVGIRKLLPEDWTKVAWVDADIEFDNFHWVEDTLNLLNLYDIVQMFSHALDLDYSEKPMHIWQGAAYQYQHQMKKGTGLDYWHPGYAWACTRKAYDQMGGLFDRGVLGSGDDHMFKAWMGSYDSVPKDVEDGYRLALKEYTERCIGLDIGYVPGVIRHYFHGSKKNRKYTERWTILIKHKFNPYKHLIRNEDGLVIASNTVSKELLDDIMNYFKERNEDEIQ